MSDSSSGGVGFCQGRAVRPRRRRPRRGGLDGFRPRSYGNAGCGGRHRQGCTKHDADASPIKSQACSWPGDLRVVGVLSGGVGATWGTWASVILRSRSTRSSAGGWVCSVSQMKGTGWSWMSAWISRKSASSSACPRRGGVLVCGVLAFAPVGAPERGGDTQPEPAAAKRDDPPEGRQQGAEQRDRQQQPRRRRDERDSPALLLFPAPGAGG